MKLINNKNDSPAGTTRAATSRIAGTGSYIPEIVLSNVECAAWAGVTPAWIERRTGIRERRIAPAGMGSAAMATGAAQAALENARMMASDVELIIVATSTPDHLTPPTACEVQAALGAARAACFDVEAGFAAWIYALITANALLSDEAAGNALVIGVDKLSGVTDRSDPETGPLFGDGAGAVVLHTADGFAAVGASSWWADGRLARALVRRGGGALQPFDEQVLSERSHLLRMEGTRLFRHAVRTMVAQARAALERARIDLDDVALVIPHQANLRIIQAFARTAGVPLSKVFVNIDRYGNTGAATVPLALDEAVRSGLPPTGALLLVGFGAGATAGAIVLDR